MDPSTDRPTASAEAVDRETLNGLSPEEQVMALQSLGAGGVAALQCVLRYVREYHELVEEGLPNDSGSGEYLRRACDLLSRAEGWTDAFAPFYTPATEFDQLDLTILLEGVVKRCRTVPESAGRMHFQPPQEAGLIIRGSLFQLQDLFLRLLSFHITPGAELHLDLRGETLPKRFLRATRSPCPAGRYVLVSLSTKQAFQIERAEPFLDAFLNQWFGDDKHNANRRQQALLPLYGIARIHDGDIFVNREEQRVTALGIAFPALETREQMQAPANVAEADLKGSETILLVDDEDMIWDVIIDMLQELGYSVILAADGREAVEIYQANAPEIDLILLDMVMPEMTGSEAFYHLKDVRSDVKVLLSSGYVGEEQAQSLLRDGACGFLEKPYSMEALARRIRNILDS